jgi:hypothetical protein
MYSTSTTEFYCFFKELGWYVDHIARDPVTLLCLPYLTVMSLTVRLLDLSVSVSVTHDSILLTRENINAVR